MPVEPEIQRVRERDDIAAIRERVHDLPNVFGTGIGYKFEDGQQTDQPAILVYVDTKVPESQLAADEIVPAEINGLPLDVFQAEPGEEFAPLRHERVRPILGGLRVSSGTSYGTLGGGFVDGAGTLVGITNAHLVHDAEATTSELVGKEITQPISDTGQTDGNVLGTVTAAEYYKTDSTTQDWATFSIDDPAWFTNEILGVGAMGAFREPSFDEPVVMTGTTKLKWPAGLRHGRLIAVDVSAGGRGPAYHYTDMSAPGDSGAIVGTVDPATGTFHPFALHYYSGSYGLRLDTVMTRAGLTRDTGTYTRSAPVMPGHFEGTPVSDDTTRNTVTALVANLGGESATRTVELRTPNGRVLDTHTTTLGPLDYEYVPMETGGSAAVIYDPIDSESEISILSDGATTGVVAGTFTLDGTATSGAKATVLDQETAPAEVVGTATTDTNGNWSVNVGRNTKVNCLFEYETTGGLKHHAHNQPSVIVNSYPDFWSGALHRYNIDEGTGTAVADTGAATTTSDLALNGPTWSTTAAYGSSSVSFDGVDDRATASSQSSMSGFSEMSVLGWVYGRSTARQGIASVYDTTGDQRSWYLVQYDGTEYQVNLSPDGGTFKSWYFNEVKLNQWNRLGFRWRVGEHPELIFNGEVHPPRRTATPPSTSLFQSTAPLDVGSLTYSTAQYFDGLIDGPLMVFDRALTMSEIQADYHAFEVA